MCLLASNLHSTALLSCQTPKWRAAADEALVLLCCQKGPVQVTVLLQAAAPRAVLAEDVAGERPRTRLNPAEAGGLWAAARSVPALTRLTHAPSP